VDTARLDAAPRAQRRKAFGIAAVKPHGIAAGAEIGSGRAAAMSGAEHRD
jgi:hypothetical protein